MKPVYVAGAESHGLYWTDEDCLVLVSTQANIVPPTNIYTTPEGRYVTRKGQEKRYSYISKKDALIELILRGEGAKLSKDDLNFIDGARIK